MAGLSLTTTTAQPSDREILGYSRYVVLIAAFFAMFVISPFEYAWSSMSGHIGATYGWSHEQIGLMFTLFVILQSIGTLPGGVLRDRFAPARRRQSAVSSRAWDSWLWPLGPRTRSCWHCGVSAAFSPDSSTTTPSRPLTNGSLIAGG